MPLSLTFDHRACTGGEAARFLKALLDDLARRTDAPDTARSQQRPRPHARPMENAPWPTAAALPVSSSTARPTTSTPPRTFWSQALGVPIADPDAGDEAGTYARCSATRRGDLHIEVQKVDHPSRVHLDIETDDIDAEVARLEKLGAKKIGVREALVGDGSADRAALLRGADAAPGAAVAAEVWASALPDAFA